MVIGWTFLAGHLRSPKRREHRSARDRYQSTAALGRRQLKEGLSPKPSPRLLGRWPPSSAGRTSVVRTVEPKPDVPSPKSTMASCAMRAATRARVCSSCAGRTAQGWRERGQQLPEFKRHRRANRVRQDNAPRRRKRYCSILASRPSQCQRHLRASRFASIGTVGRITALQDVGLAGAAAG